MKKKGYLGRNAYRAFASKTAPVDVEALHQRELLTILLGSPAAASALMRATTSLDDPDAAPDLRSLIGMDIRDLAAIPGVGESSAAKVAALFGLLVQLARKPA